MRGLRVFQRKRVRGLRLFSRVKISDLPAYVPINFGPSLTPKTDNARKQAVRRPWVIR